MPWNLGCSRSITRACLSCAARDSAAFAVPPPSDVCIVASTFAPTCSPWQMKLTAFVVSPAQIVSLPQPALQLGVHLFRPRQLDLEVKPPRRELLGLCDPRAVDPMVGFEVQQEVAFPSLHA